MKVILAPYDPDWPQLFEKERKQLTTMLGSLLPVIEHIGSTSVPGLIAKPIIDIMAGVRCFDDLIRASQLMQQPGYVFIRKYEDVMPFRRYFVKTSLTDPAQLPGIINQGEDTPAIVSDNKTHHIHMVEINSPFWKDHLLFRDYLHTHAEARIAYGLLKQKLAEREWKDGNEYVAAKAGFIRSIIDKARHED